MALALPMERASRCVPPQPGMMPERDFRLAEFRRVGGNDEIAHQGQFAAAAQAIAGNGSDHGLAECR